MGNTEGKLRVTEDLWRPTHNGQANQCCISQAYELCVDMDQILVPCRHNKSKLL